MVDEVDFANQVSVFDTLADEKRLRILKRTVDGPVAAPRLAEEDEFGVSAESILYHLNLLESAGFLESKTVQGQYKRPHKEFHLVGNGKQLLFEVTKNGDYAFEFREPPIA